MLPAGLRRAWDRLPVIARAVVVGYAVLVVGQIPPGVFLLANLRLTPDVPWFLAATAVWLGGFWRYLSGHGPPANTAPVRRRDLRAGSVTRSVWAWSLVAGGLGMLSVMSLALLTGRLAELPEAAFEPPFDLSPYPRWTVVAFFLNVAMVAGVVEETAFRGFMLSPIQRRHGWAVGIVTVGLAFYLAHVSHAYATLAFMPFFILYSVLLGLLVMLTGSIVPGILLHAVGDAVVIPIQYGMLPSPLGASVSTHAWAIVGFGVASAWAFLKLAATVRRESAAVAAHRIQVAEPGG